MEALLITTRDVGNADTKQHTMCIVVAITTGYHACKLGEVCIVDEGNVVLCVGGDNGLFGTRECRQTWKWGADKI